MGRSVIRRGNLTLYPNYKLGEQLRRSQIYDAELRRLADLGRLGAQEIAVKSAFDTGAYYNSIRAEVGRNRRGLAEGRVVAEDFKSHWLERGWTTRSGRVVPGRNILRRGARRSGLKVRAPRKRG
jgi:hypothetical protein